MWPCEWPLLPTAEGEKSVLRARKVDSKKLIGCGGASLSMADPVHGQFITAINAGHSLRSTLAQRISYNCNAIKGNIPVPDLDQAIDSPGLEVESSEGKDLPFQEGLSTGKGPKLYGLVPLNYIGEHCDWFCVPCG
jgi:hypothetical protein